MKPYYNKIIRAVTISNSIQFFDAVLSDLKSKGYEIVVLSSPGPELKVLNRIGVKTIELSMERRISLFKDIVSLFRLIRVFMSEKPMMVHSMTPKAGLLCMFAAWFSRVPRRVHTFTGLIWPTTTGITRKILMFTDWITCSCATHIIPEGEGVKNDLKKFITKKPMKVLGYGNVRGLDMEYWRITNDLKIESMKLRESLWITSHNEDEKLFNFIFVGRLVGDKGINELVEAFVKLKEHFLNLNNGQNIRLLLVGPTEENIDPLKQVTWHKIRNTESIIEVGQIQRGNILKYYAASDCFVFPSYREGFPNAVIEAGAMGLPSIVTDINGAREIIIDGKNGFVIPSKDTKALYDAMLKIVENNEIRHKMAENARPMIESRFEQSFVKKCLFDFYEEIMPSS